MPAKQESFTKTELRAGVLVLLGLVLDHPDLVDVDPLVRQAAAGEEPGAPGVHDHEPNLASLRHDTPR